MRVDFNNPTVKYSQTKYNPLWDLMLPPITDNRYDPAQFHVDMWNEWSGQVCMNHRHKV